MASRTENRGVNIYINGKQAEGSLKDLKNQSRQLNNELGKLTPGTEAFRKKAMELRSVNERLQSIKDDIKGVNESFAWLKSEVGKLGVLAAGVLGFDALSSKMGDIISQNSEMSDTIADVMKTTGLTETAVRRLNSEFQKIDTRTSRQELNGLAYVAGKLGISAEKDVLAFVRAADQISVALGEDLGGAEEAINSLGKLTDIFKLKDVYGIEEALLKVGSVINDLGAAGTANEGNMVRWVQRMAGIAPAANVSAQATFALAATMDQFGQGIESSSTAVGQFLVKMGADVPKYAKIAGLSTQEFSKILKKDAAEALTLVLGKVSNTTGGIQSLADGMGLIGVENQQAVQALGVLASNLDTFKTNLDLANQSFALGNSVTAEFDVKNNTLAARIDKLKKKFTDFTTNFTFNDLLIKGVMIITSFVGALERNFDTIVNLAKVVLTATVAIGSYRAAVLIADLATKGFTLTIVIGEKAMTLARISTIALAGAKALLSGNLVKARQAWNLLNLSMAANPIGLVVAGVTALTAALILFSGRLSPAAQAMKDYNDVMAEAERTTIAERLAIERAQKAMLNEKKSREQRLKAVADLRQIMPDVLKDYSDEELLAGKATRAIEKQTKAILNRAKMRAYENQITKLEEENIKIDQDLGENISDRSLTNPLNAFANWKYLNLLNRKMANQARIKELESGLEGLNDAPETTKPADIPVDNNGVTPGLTKEQLKAQKAAERAAKAAAKKEASLQEQIDNSLSRFQTKADKSEDGADSKLVQMEAEYKRLMDLAKGNEEAQTQITEAFGRARQNRVLEILKEGASKQREQMRKDLESQQQEQAAADAALYKQKLDAIDQMNASEQEKDVARQVLKQEQEASDFEKQQENLVARWAMLEAMEELGDLELEEARRIADEKANIEKQVTDNAIAENERLARQRLDIATKTQQAETSLREATTSAYEASFGLLRELFKENKQIAMLFLLGEKAAAAASVIIKLQQEIAGYYASNAALGPAGVAIATKLALAAKIRAGVSLATIATQTLGQFEDGGYSNTPQDNGKPVGWVRRPTIFTNSSSGRPFIAGEGYKPEYIISSEQLKDPVIADFVAMMEANRGIRRFEQGGYNAPPNGPSSVTVPGMEVLTALMTQLINATEQAQDKKVNLPWSDLQLQNDKIVKIQNRVNS
ncbi:MULTISPECIES: phage tail tape measure protein [Olivibacter]|uniref:Phage tail tape measure protein n=1 Tax=Olivibacter jilunii TaxID=985016 RepID=A0ABW6AZE4_9SPHI